MVDQDQKIWARIQIIDIGKYSFVNTTIKLWNQLSAEALANILSRSHNFKKRVRKVTISEVKWCEVRWSKVKIFGGMCQLLRIYNYVVCMCFSLQYVFLLSNCLRAICFMSLALWKVPINYFFLYDLLVCSVFFF